MPAYGIEDPRLGYNEKRAVQAGPFQVFIEFVQKARPHMNLIWRGGQVHLDCLQDALLLFSVGPTGRIVSVRRLRRPLHYGRALHKKSIAPDETPCATVERFA